MMNLGATRRELLAGLGALAFAPSAPGGSQARLRSLLDRIATAGEPEAMLALVRRAPGEGLDRAERELLRMVTRGLERDVALRRHFPFGKPDGSSPYVLSQRHGTCLEIGVAESSSAGKESSSAGKVGRLDEETERLSADSGLGIVPPSFMLDAILKAQTALQGKAAPEVRSALGRQIAALLRLRARAASAPGVWRLPGGDEHYRLRLRCATGLEYSPAQIERRVEAETAALLGRADGLLKGLGLVRGSVGARLRALQRRPEHVFRRMRRAETAPSPA